VAEIPFIRHNNSIRVAGNADGVPVTFIWDTGADMTSLPSSLVRYSEEDIVDWMTFRMANGTRERDPIVRVRKLTIGGVTFNNVECAITSGSSDALVGGNLMKLFDRWSMDNQRGVIMATWR
jgi:predicted aspartyl protease